MKKRSRFDWATYVLLFLMPLAVLYEVFLNGHQGDENFVLLFGGIIWLICVFLQMHVYAKRK